MRKRRKVANSHFYINKIFVKSKRPNSHFEFQIKSNQIPNSKRSQSNIIAMILIILLVLAAIIIVWNVVNRVVKKGAEGIGTEALTVNLEILEAKLWVTGRAEVKVHRNSGKGDITELKFIFEKSDGETEIITRKTPDYEMPDELETKPIKFNSSELPFNNSEIEKVSIAPVFGNNLGTQVYEPTPETDSSGERVLDAPSDRSLVSWWMFDGNFEDSVGGNDGSAYGNANTNGNVLNLGGNGDYVSVTSSPPISTTGNFTYSLWLKVNSYANGELTDGYGDYFLDRTADTNALVSLKAVSGKYAFQKRYNDGSGLGGITTTTAISSNWAHIIMMREAGINFSIYVNGILENAISDTGNTLTPPTPKIGCHATTNTDALNGTIDDVMIFNKALSSDEIKTIYNNQKK